MGVPIAACLPGRHEPRDGPDRGDVAPGWAAHRLAEHEPALRAAAIAHNDEHAIKLVHTAWQFGRLDPDPVWRQAAARALQSFATMG